VDISESMIQQAKSNYPDKLFRVADAQQTAYPDASFRQIFALHLLMHLSVSHIKSILKEAYRICEKGGTLLVDFPSAQRRQLVGHQQKGWHGATAFSLDEFKNIALESGWLLKKSRGIALFPVHRLPESMRAVVLPLDSLIGQSPLKAYASYLMVKLEKQ
jgi:SAM-dependent methyltransferase